MTSKFDLVHQKNLYGHLLVSKHISFNTFDEAKDELDKIKKEIKLDKNVKINKDFNKCFEYTVNNDEHTYYIIETVDKN